MLKVSIIVPVYKTEQYLDQCVQSLLKQTFQGIEIILVDDGSPDNCGEICDYYARKYPVLVKTIHQKNQGVSVARNTGIETATGEWIMFVDSDDWIELNMVESILACSEKTCCDICVCPGSRDTDIIHKRYEFRYKNNRILTDNDKIALFKNNFHPVAIGESGRLSFAVPWSKLYSTSLLKTHSIKFIPGLRYGEDMVFNLYAFHHARSIVIHPEYYYHYRTNDASVSQSYRLDAFQSVKKLCEEINLFANRFYSKNEASAIYSAEALFLLTDALQNNYIATNSPLTRQKRIKEIKSIIEKEPYKSIIRNVNKQDITRKRKVQLYLLKYRLIITYYLLMYISTKLNENSRFCIHKFNKYRHYHKR